MPTDVTAFALQMQSGRVDDPAGLVSALWAMRREDRHVEALNLADQALGILPDEPALRDVGAMLFYDVRVKNLPDDADVPTCNRISRDAERYRAVPINGKSVYGNIYSYRLVALKLAQIVVEREPILALRILETLVVGALPTDRKTTEQGGGPTTLLRSDRDKYYLWITKALEKAGRNEDLLQLEPVAIPALDGSQHQHWIVMRLVKAAIGLGDFDKANQLAMHRSVDRRNPQWVPLIAQIQAGQGDSDGAIASLKKLIVRAKDLSFQVNNIARLAALIRADHPAIADSLTMLEFRVRSGKGWAIKAELKARVDQIISAGAEQWDDKQIRAWMEESAGMPVSARGTGVVKSHLPNGASGFIARDGLEDLYFVMPRGSTEPLPAIGARVTFVVEPSFDKKRNRNSERAVDVRRVEG
jgi:hypothetical protein